MGIVLVPVEYVFLYMFLGISIGALAGWHQRGFKALDEKCELNKTNSIQIKSTFKGW